MPTGWKAKKVLMHHLPSRIEGTIVELGAGFGTLALPLSKKYPEHKVLAYEISPFPYLVLITLKLILKRKNLLVFRKNFFNENLRAVGLCVCYLYPEAMSRLEKKLTHELQSGAYVISNTFTLPGRRPVQTCDVKDLWHSQIFLYRI